MVTCILGCATTIRNVASIWLIVLDNWQGAGGRRTARRMGGVRVGTKVQPCVLRTLPTKEFANVTGLKISLDVKRIDFIVTGAERSHGKHK